MFKYFLQDVHRKGRLNSPINVVMEIEGNSPGNFYSSILGNIK